MRLVILGELSVSSYSMFLRKCTKSFITLASKVEEIFLVACLIRLYCLDCILLY